MVYKKMIKNFKIFALVLKWNNCTQKNNKKLLGFIRIVLLLAPSPGDGVLCCNLVHTAGIHGTLVPHYAQLALRERQSQRWHIDLIQITQEMLVKQ